MKRVIHKIGLVFLVLLITAPVFYVFIFHIQQYTIRQLMKERLEDHHLETVMIAEKNLHWARVGKEIWVDNRLFDIKDCTAKNGFYTFTGYFDDDETALVQMLEQKQQQSSTGKEDVLARLFHLLQHVYHNPGEENFSALRNTRQELLGGQPLLPAVFISILTPPPQI